MDAWSTKFEVLPLLKMTEIEFGRQMAKLKGRKRISEEMAKRYAFMDYHSAMRGLLEDRKYSLKEDTYQTIEELYDAYQKYADMATTKDALSGLRAGFSIKLHYREGNYSDAQYMYRNDPDWQAINGANVSVNNVEKVFAYFREKKVTKHSKQLNEKLKQAINN